jgi:hypothetical protein
VHLIQKPVAFNDKRNHLDPVLLGSDEEAFALLKKGMKLDFDYADSPLLLIKVHN